MQEFFASYLIFMLGVGLVSLVKPFYDGLAEEAGKDFWNVLKRLVAKIWEKQSSDAYAMSSDAYIIFELKDEHVGIRLSLSHVIKGEMGIQDFESLIDQSLKGLAASWEEIQSDIDQFDIGSSDANLPDFTQAFDKRIYIIRRAGKGWRIFAENSSEFFEKYE
jgi:hypothetical protein